VLGTVAVVYLRLFWNEFILARRPPCGTGMLVQGFKQALCSRSSYLLSGTHIPLPLLRSLSLAHGTSFEISF